MSTSKPQDDLAQFLQQHGLTEKELDSMSPDDPRAPGLAWRTLPPGMMGPEGPPHPLHGMKWGDEHQPMFAAAVMDQLLPHLDLWRTGAKDKRRFSDEFIKGRLNLGADRWPTLDDCIPPGSIFAVADAYHRANADLPRELTFHNLLHYISAILLQSGSVIKTGKKKIVYPDPWTIILAPSGAGKSETRRGVAEALSAHEITRFQNANSSLQFLEHLEHFRLGLWVRDEFAQFIKQVKDEQNMKQVKDFLLQTYDNADIHYHSKATSLVVEKSCISILGSTPLATITESITKEMLLDGFAQRFTFVIAERHRKVGEDRISYFEFDGLEDELQEPLARITAAPFHKEYQVELFERQGAYHRAYNMIFDRAESLGVDDSFTQRIVWRTWKNALVYHVVLGKTNDVIDSEDLMYGARLAAISLRDLRRTLDLFDAAFPTRGRVPGQGSHAKGRPPATFETSAAAGPAAAPAVPVAPAAPAAPVDPAAARAAFLAEVRARVVAVHTRRKILIDTSTLKTYMKTTPTDDLRSALAELKSTDPAVAVMIAGK